MRDVRPQASGTRSSARRNAFGDSWVFRARAPTEADIERTIERLATSPFSYAEVGATRTACPPGFAPGGITAVIGAGEREAVRAADALRRWRMFDLGWVRSHRADVAQEPGACFAFAARTFGIWSVHVCRVVYRVDEDDGRLRRTGFAYGTLAGHALAGEERFLVTWDRATDQVTFSLDKFSRPSHRVLVLGGPVVRRVQRRFDVDAVTRMRRAAGGFDG